MTEPRRRLVRVIPWALAALLAVAATLVSVLPASWVSERFGALTGQRVLLLDPDGSLWRGSATLALAAGPNQGPPTALPGRVAWRTAFWPLFAGRIQMEMQDPSALAEPVQIDATRHYATLSPGALNVPASLLTGLGAPFNTLEFEGNLRLQWDTMRLLNDQAFGRLQIVLTDMASRVSRVRPLGSYRVVIDADGKGGTLALVTLKGPLKLDGNGTLGAGGFAFSGTASSDPAQLESLLALLNLLGRPEPDGRYRLTFNRP